MSRDPVMRRLYKSSQMKSRRETFNGWCQWCNRPRDVKYDPGRRELVGLSCPSCDLVRFE